MKVGDAVEKERERIGVLRHRGDSPWITESEMVEDRIFGYSIHQKRRE
jgi:hypothetical protein